jgi:hypothetical protein
VRSSTKPDAAITFTPAASIFYGGNVTTHFRKWSSSGSRVFRAGFIGLVILDELIYLRRRAFLLHLRKPYARQRDDQHQPELC